MIDTQDDKIMTFQNHETVLLSIVMPCLNEAETLEQCIQKAKTGLNAVGVEGEIVVADNGSSDGSQDIARRNGARVIDVKQRGYGAALKAGIAASRGKYVIMADADDSYDWAKLEPFVKGLQEGNQLVMGSRLRGVILPDAMPPLHRWLGNPVLTALGNILFSTRISDYHCGMRGFDREAILALDLHTPGMEFATEMVAKAAMARLKISEAPITYSPDGRSRRPHLRTWRDGWRHLSFMLLLSPTWIFFYPGLFMVAFGILGNLLLIPGPLYVANIGFDVHTLLVSNSAVVIGVSILSFGLVARLFAVNSGILKSLSKFGWLVHPSFLSISLAVGLILFLLGIVPIVESLNLWASVQFGDLDYRVILRLLLPGLTICTVGIQIFFLSFVISLLNFQKNWS